ncbi:MAG TPA: hypothetical protein QF800_04840 [Phycisphaerales bacterium]|nr:hypothetical protein [Phycisphaerales bacterium]
MIEPMFGLVGLWYWLVIPLVIGISMVYKAIRIPEDGPWGREVIIMTAQVLVGLVALAVLLGVMVKYVIPSLG